MVYFAQIASTGGIKIGFSDDVPTRIGQLEQKYGCPVALLGTEPGGRQKEREIHRVLAAFRLGKTEQFRPAREVLEFIGKPLLVAADPYAVEVAPDRTGMVTKVIRVRREYADWLDCFASHQRANPAILIDRAVAEYAERVGFDPAPPRL